MLGATDEEVKVIDTTADALNFEERFRTDVRSEMKRVSPERGVYWKTEPAVPESDGKVHAVSAHQYR
jgi:hypothetical protein